MTNLKPRISPEQLTQGVSLNSPLETSIANFAAAVVSAKTVNPLITELVRLRCAQIHDCRLCGSLRNQEALDEGFDETMQRKIATYENSDFSPEIIVALKLCDAIILSPMLANNALKEELNRYFSSQQISEICLDVMKWSQQKALVALRIEAPIRKYISVLSFDEKGQPHIGGNAYEK
jgi:alkylhydroperoxidase family enzyme|tara:strand:+ start:13523 stop:14056 length:534 start_codon:yes stop_codon:yes gene_type:complete